MKERKSEKERGRVNDLRKSERPFLQGHSQRCHQLLRWLPGRCFQYSGALDQPEPAHNSLIILTTSSRMLVKGCQQFTRQPGRVNLT